MKRTIFSILCVAVFFVGIGTLVEKAGAKFKSDEKALALVAKARTAIGGDTAINAVQSMRIVGQTAQTFKLNGVAHTEDGEAEIALQFPDRMMKSIKMGHDDGNGEMRQMVSRSVDLVVTGDEMANMKVRVGGENRGEGHGEGTGVGVSNRILIKKDDGTVQELTGADAEKWIASHHDEVAGGNRLIVKKVDGSAEVVEGPEGAKVGEKVAGGTVIRKIDGGNATFKTENGKTMIVTKDDGANVEFSTGGKVGDGDHFFMTRDGGHHDGARQNDLLRTTLSLLLTAPKGMEINYTLGGDGDVDGTSCDIVVAEFGGSSYKLYLSKASSLPVMMSYTGIRTPQIFTFKADPSKSADAEKGELVFTSKVAHPVSDTAEYSVKFSDYRSVNGLQLPFHWVQTGGDADETYDVTSYEINPANIADNFHGEKLMVRTKKPDGQK